MMGINEINFFNQINEMLMKVLFSLSELGSMTSNIFTCDNENKGVAYV